MVSLSGLELVEPGGGSSVHTHVEGDVTGLPADLAAKVDLSALNELVDDRVAALIAAGSGVTATYNDAGNLLTITATTAFFEFGVLAAAFSNVNWATFAQTSTRYYCGNRLTDNNNQNNELVYALPQALTAGTWKLVLVHTQLTSAGIYTIAVSPDASTWTDLATVDGYAASTTGNVRSEVTGLTVAAGMRYVRLKMATKNASSTGYGAQIHVFTGVRTGA